MHKIVPNKFVSASRATELEVKVVAAVNHYMDAAYRRWTTLKMKLPTIQYDLRGTVGGQASPRANAIRVNAILLHENEEHYLHQVVPHELAHLIAASLHGRVQAHGYEWKSIMRGLGKEPDRCHTMDVTNAQVKKKRTITCFCGRCGKDIMMTKRGVDQLHRYTTKCCKVPVVRVKPGTGTSPAKPEPVLVSATPIPGPWDRQLIAIIKAHGGLPLSNRAKVNIMLDLHLLNFNHVEQQVRRLVDYKFI